MKCLVTYTIFTEAWCQAKWYAQEYTKKIGEQLKYKLLKQVTGRHEDAERIHYHICCLYELEEEAKQYKVLNEKINRISLEILYPGNKTDKIDRKVSFIYEGQQKTFKGKIKLYDESAIQYPLKEYDNDLIIPYENCIGIEKKELQQMRKLAHMEYLNAKRKQEQFKAEQEAKKQEQEQEADYVKKGIEEFKPGEPYSMMMIKTLDLILTYNKIHEKQIRMNNLKDKAINYLFHLGKLSNCEIIDKLKIY